MPYEVQTEAMQIAIARRDAEQSAAEYDRKIAARLRELAAAHHVTDEKVLAQLARGDDTLRDLIFRAFVAANMPQWQSAGIPLDKALRRWWPGGRAA